ncbi:MAG: LytTR family DNA-binding domain-containing protein [Bacteroidia bacterium]|nr:LytTR family DNA-binding domain-containing protein [Bacteroidia bacterium]
MNTLWRTLIIDDEVLARDRLKRLLGNIDNVFQIIGEASDGDQAQKMIESLKPDIIFLDVQMPGKNVFTMLTEIRHKPFVVFCTAFDHYALDAFNSHSVDYLIKPVEEERLRRTVEKLDKITERSFNGSLHSVLEAIKKMEPRQIPTSIPHKVGDKTILVKLEQVVFLQAEDKYVNFYNAEGKKFMSDQSLKTLEEKLPVNFIRVSKSIILNRNFVNEVHRYFRGKVIFVMHDINKTKITSGSTYSDIIKKTFDL